jgi:hypothetical protein
MAVKREKPKAAVPPIAPGDFQVGSAGSRAAVRALLEAREKNKQVFRITIELIGHPKDKPLPEGWRKEWDGGATECIYTRA